MSEIHKYKIMLFYNEQNDICVSTNITLQEYAKNQRDKINLDIELVDEYVDNVTFKKYKVGGIPTILFFKNFRMVKRWLGEINYDSLNKLMQEITNNK